MLWAYRTWTWDVWPWSANGQLANELAQRTAHISQQAAQQQPHAARPSRRNKELAVRARVAIDVWPRSLPARLVVSHHGGAPPATPYRAVGSGG
eukprot:COSAG01_NODE_4392_length_5071_cov_14.381738_11_plen_94_part_00